MQTDTVTDREWWAGFCGTVFALRRGAKPRLLLWVEIGILKLCILQLEVQEDATQNIHREEPCLDSRSSGFCHFHKASRRVGSADRHRHRQEVVGGILL